MARYIDADLILPHIDEEIAICKEQERVSPSASANRIGLQVARSFIATAPTADVVEVKHGKWIYTGSCQVCSICDEEQYGVDTGRFYCPNCGAKMDGGE